MEDALVKEYPYPPQPTTHGLPDADCDFDPDEETGALGPFEIGT